MWVNDGGKQLTQDQISRVSMFNSIITNDKEQIRKLEMEKTKLEEEKPKYEKAFQNISLVNNNLGKINSQIISLKDSLNKAYINPKTNLLTPWVNRVSQVETGNVMVQNIYYAIKKRQEEIPKEIERINNKIKALEREIADAESGIRDLQL